MALLYDRLLYSPWCPTRAHPASRNQPKSFWIAGQRDILSYKCSPWDFYELLASCESDVSLVLCNKGSEIRVMKTHRGISDDFNFPQMQHLNILDIYKVYFFKGRIFVIFGYLDFSRSECYRQKVVRLSVKKTRLILCSAFSTSICRSSMARGRRVHSSGFKKRSARVCILYRVSVQRLSIRGRRPSKDGMLPDSG
jgi:hypothetical protein